MLEVALVASIDCRTSSRINSRHRSNKIIIGTARARQASFFFVSRFKRQTPSSFSRSRCRGTWKINKHLHKPFTFAPFDVIFHSIAFVRLKFRSSFLMRRKQGKKRFDSLALRCLFRHNFTVKNRLIIPAKRLSCSSEKLWARIYSNVWRVKAIPASHSGHIHIPIYAFDESMFYIKGLLKISVDMEVYENRFLYLFCTWEGLLHRV